MLGNGTDQEEAFSNMLRNALSGSKKSVILPSFNMADPELWFSVTDVTLADAGIVNERDKYICVVKSLDNRAQLEVRDILVNTPAENQYTLIKSELIKRLSSSQEEKTRRLLEMEEMGDRKPSQFLRPLCRLGGTAMPDAMLRTLWSGRLPSDVQAILAAHKDMELDKVADLADKIYDLTRRRPVIAETSSSNDSLVQQFSAVLGAVMKEIASLQADVLENRGRDNTYKGGRSSRSRSSSRNRQPSNGICWYHTTFDGKSRSCLKPCAYVAEN